MITSCVSVGLFIFYPFFNKTDRLVYKKLKNYTWDEVKMPKGFPDLSRFGGENYFHQSQDEKFILVANFNGPRSNMNKSYLLFEKNSSSVSKLIDEAASYKSLIGFYGPGGEALKRVFENLLKSDMANFQRQVKLKQKQDIKTLQNALK